MNRGIIFCLFLFFSAIGAVPVYLNYVKVRFDFLALLILFSLLAIVLLPKIMDAEPQTEEQ